MATANSNGRIDGTQALLSQNEDWASVILNNQNLECGRACNLGSARVQTPYTLCLNPDAKIEPEAFGTALAFMDSHSNVGVVGPATFCGGEDPHAMQVTGRLPTPMSMLPKVIVPFRDAPELRPIRAGEPPFKTGWVCGAVFLTRTRLMKELGGFDPRFFLYWEETDVCRRVCDLAFEVWTLGGAVAHHRRSASSCEDGTRIDGCVARHFYQSRRYYMIKHHGGLAATAAEVAEFIWLAVRTIGDGLRGRGFSGITPRLQAPLLSQPGRV